MRAIRRIARSRGGLRTRSVAARRSLNTALTVSANFLARRDALFGRGVQEALVSPRRLECLERVQEVVVAYSSWVSALRYLAQQY